MIPRLKCWLFGHNIDENNFKEYRDNFFMIPSGSYSEWFKRRHLCKRCNEYIRWDKRVLVKYYLYFDGKYHSDQQWMK